MPYSDLPPHAFWRRCIESDTHLLQALYRPRFQLQAGDKIATAGSCFAQHFGTHVKASNLHFVDMEPAPDEMPDDVAKRHGYRLYSARYGNLYTARQLLQLLQDCMSISIRDCAIWADGARYFDGLRPTVEPQGFTSETELIAHRASHLRRVRKMVKQCDIFVFTLGLTEAWTDAATGTVFPMAPGTIAGTFDKDRHHFVNFSVFDVMEDLDVILDLLKSINPRIRVLFTVSPVPLTATASGQHIVQATTYSKSTLRVAVAEIVKAHTCADYFPSYEIITSTMFKSRFYNSNLRTVTPEGVSTVMSVFFGAHKALRSDVPMVTTPPEHHNGDDAEDALICEEVMLAEFSKQ